jgi:GAF domain-containing protein
MIAMVNELVQDSRASVLPLGEALREMGSGSGRGSAWIQVKEAVPEPGESAARSREGYTSDSSFDVGPLLGADLREKLGTLSLDGDGDQLLHEILEMAIRVTQADSGSIMLVDEFGTLRVAVADGLPQWVIAHARQEVGKGISGQVFATGKPRLLHGHLQPGRSGSADVRPGLREAACVAIPTKEGPIGVLNVSVESEERTLDEQSIALLNLFAREASAAVLKALNLNLLSGSTQREAVIRQIERLMTLQESLPARLRSAADALGQALRADYAHCLVVDPSGAHLELFGAAKGLAVLRSDPQPVDRGFLGWALRRSCPTLLEALDQASGDRVALAYLPVISGRSQALLVLERIPLTGTAAANALNLLNAAKEKVEAQMALEETTGDWELDDEEGEARASA